MNAPVAAPPSRHLGRSTLAIIAGMVVVIVLSEGTDMVLRLAHVFPAASGAMTDTRLFALALGYRCVYNVIAAWLVARLAPRNPARHLVVFAGIGLVLGSLGVVMNFVYHLGPDWYPIALALSPIPCTWLGWRVSRAASAGR